MFAHISSVFFVIAARCILCFGHDPHELQVHSQYPSYTPCHNMCNGHGKCRAPYGECDCFNGYTGADCSLRTCPFGTAWTDHATADDVAHGLAECSNRGQCDRTNGHCVCQSGFEGASCGRLSCPNNCSMKGRCVSASRLASMQDPGSLRKDEGCTSAHICQDVDCNDREYSACTETMDYSEPWEADMMFGCKCDNGYSGFDCSQRTCVTGDDPLTGSQQNEVQLLECQATQGTFTLSFMGQTTKPISYDAEISEFTEALSAIPTLKGGSSPKITVQWLVTSDTVCSESGNDIQVTFLQNFGDLPLLIPDGSKLGHDSAGQSPLITSQKILAGDKEADVCSNRGTCSSSTGICYCLDDWTTSDGYGGAGTRGDCGYKLVGTTSACPGEPACLGYGTCSGSPEYRCDCQEGRHGPDCALMSCPKGKSWFSAPSAPNIGHSLAECSDMGICDPNTGVCSCADGFTGGACEYMRCPGRPLECNGNGQCISVASLAESSEINGEPASYTYGTDPNNPLTWDSDQMLGCLCHDGFEGYDCSLRSCPKGDDPQTPYQENEVQQIACTDDDDNGSFRLSFRSQTTEQMSILADIEELEARLNDLHSIERVSVAYADPNIYIGASGLDPDALQLCRSSGQLINIEFESPTGDVPLLYLGDEDIVDISGGVLVTELTKGTKEYTTCSGRGLCDHTTGLCSCFTGFASSNGQGEPGTLANCGYKRPF